jgi:membrane protein DedA with SNARE-associated domain
MPLGGYLASIGSISVIGAILTCTVGSALGTVPYYYLGKYLHRERLTLLVQKYGHWIGYKTEYLDDLYETFATHGPSIVFSSRFIPGARSIISLPAGSAGMPLGQLMIYSIAG